MKYHLALLSTLLLFFMAPMVVAFDIPEQTQRVTSGNQLSIIDSSSEVSSRCDSEFGKSSISKFSHYTLDGCVYIKTASGYKKVCS